MRSEAWRPAAGARNRAPREARDSALQALRPGCEELAVTDPAQMPVRQARPREPKTATVERREASVPRHGTQGASLGAWHAALWRAPRVPLHPNVSRRSAHPSIRGEGRKDAKPGRKTRRGNEKI